MNKTFSISVMVLIIFLPIVYGGAYVEKPYEQYFPLNEALRVRTICSDEDICTIGVLKPNSEEYIFYENLNSSEYNPYFEMYEDYYPDVEGYYAFGVCTGIDCQVDYNISSYQTDIHRFYVKESEYQKEIHKIRKTLEKIAKTVRCLIKQKTGCLD